AMALAVFVNRLLSGMVALTFLSLVDAVTYANTFYLFAVISFISTIFYAGFLPETMGKTLE
ncbi:polyol monosaccharide transporter, partial [Nannochloropsis gaditana CCMP526]